MKKKILILSGGISKERLISLDTGLQVAKELKKNGYIVKDENYGVAIDWIRKYINKNVQQLNISCLLYTSDAADD